MEDKEKFKQYFMTHEEIAKELGITRQAVALIIKSGLRKVKRELKKRRMYRKDLFD